MKPLFARDTQKGRLECFSTDAGIEFFLSGKEIRRKTMVNIKYLEDMRGDRYYAQVLPILEQKGYAGMWNNQIGLYQDEIDAVVAAEEEIRVAIKLKAERTIRITLSTRGWGDFEPVKWVGDKDTPDAQILAECRHLLDTEHDVDNRNQSDEEIIALIHSARAKDGQQKEERAARQKEAAAYIETVSEAVKKAYVACGGDADNLPDDIDHPLYWAVRRYAQALQDANANL